MDLLSIRKAAEGQRRDSYLTIREVAECLRCSTSFVRRELISKGKIEAKANGDVLMSELDSFLRRCNTGFKPTQLDDILKTACRKRVSGIYFLLDGRRNVVYVGQSKNMFARIGQHIREDSKLFAYYAHLEVRPEALNEAERHYISLLQPEFNISGNSLATRKTKNGTLPDDEIEPDPCRRSA